MQTPAARVVSIACLLLTAGCASRSLPAYQQPLAREQYQTVRTTAYTHTEGDHLKYSNRNASGTELQANGLKSAACDWSRWPVGTVFRVQETGETYIVDDYGWALAGTNTIDLYKASRAEMNAWGTRRIHLEILQWGDTHRSLSILKPRSGYAHVRRMVDDLQRRYSELTKPFPLVPSTPETTEVAFAEPEPPRADLVAPRSDISATTVAANVAPPQRPRTGGFSPSRPPLNPFSESR